MIWLGEQRGYLSDWTTQQWVRATGRRMRLADHEWLSGPTAGVRGVGRDFFEQYAAHSGLRAVASSGLGLLESVAALGCSGVDPAVASFYEHTSDYELDAWSEWSPVFRPFGTALAALFSRRLQQLNVPLSSLDTSRGLTSRVVHLVDAESGNLVFAAWVRELVGSRNLLYAGAYSVCRLPGHASPCIKVVFPLPNGAAMVIMRAEVHADGSLSVISAGRRFGEPGFYFLVNGRGGFGWVRYVRSMKETIQVYAAEDGLVRADHVLRLWGCTFLRLHYRLRRAAAAAVR